MKTQEHTAGPWRMGNHGQFGMFNPPQVFAEGKEAIAQVYGIPLHQTLEEIDKERFAEGLANARLIAAAPQILEALERIISELPTKRDWLDPVIEAMAKDAIKSAKGETL